jgi:hypothetical protein
VTDYGGGSLTCSYPPLPSALKYEVIVFTLSPAWTSSAEDLDRQIPNTFPCSSTIEVPDVLVDHQAQRLGGRHV